MEKSVSYVSRQEAKIAKVLLAFLAPLRDISLLLAFCLLHFASSSQNLEKIGKEDMVTLSGGINFTSMLYWSDGMTARRDPFTMYASGNLTMNILDVSVPI